MTKMSTKEIQDMISRFELERRYIDLLNERGKKHVKKGESIVKESLKKSAKNIGSQLFTYAMGAGVNAIAGSEIVNPKKGQKDK